MNASTRMSISVAKAHLERLQAQLDLIDRIAEARRKSVTAEMDKYQTKLDKLQQK